jgi:hypothetical protein
MPNRQLADQLGLISTLAISYRVGESVCHAVPDSSGNFHRFSVLPRHARNLVMPDLATNFSNGIAEGGDGFLVPSSTSRLEALRC